ncbi:TPA: conjugal transfer protein TraF, partial [Escherichia coli]
MMMKKHITRTLIASAVLFSFNSTAATSYFEARNDAMGGTGVASSHYGVAPLANPALLTKSGAKDDFSLLLPSVGAQLSDPGNITDNADKISDDWKAFERAVDAQSGVPQTAARLKAQLQDFRHTHADAQVGASAVAALPGDTLAAALMLKTFGTVSVDGKVSDADLNYLESIANSNGQNVDKNRLTSQAFARAALVTDVGIALATELETAGQKWSLGFTPKFQRVDLF